DGVHAFVNSLETTQPRAATEVRLLSRSNEILATKRTDDSGHVQFEVGLTRGEGALAPALLIATDASGDYAFLSLKAPAFDLTDRGVSGRTVPAGLDAFVYAERGVYRSGETVHVTALLRDPQGVAALGVPLTLVVERPDGVEYRRGVIADQGVGGHALDVPLVASSPTGTWRVRAFTDPKRPPVGETTFMVEDYVPDRLEFDLATTAKSVSRSQPAEITVDGRYLYGAPAAGLALEGEVVIGVAAERSGFPRYQFGLHDEKVEKGRQPLDGLPTTDRNGKAKFALTIDKQPSATQPLEAQLTVRLAEPGGRAVERRLALPVAPAGAMNGVKPLFSGRSPARERRKRKLRRGRRRTKRCRAGAQRPALRAAQDRDPLPVVPTGWVLGLRAGEDHAPGRRRPVQPHRRHAGADHHAGAMGPLPSRSVGQRPQRPGHPDRP